MSTLKVDTIKNGAGTREYFPCTAWVNFNGTGTVAIRDSGNVSSITDNGTGDYTVNFTVPMGNTDYILGGMASLLNAAGNGNGRWIHSWTSARLTSSIRVQCDQGSAIYDCVEVNIQIQGGI